MTIPVRHVIGNGNGNGNDLEVGAGAESTGLASTTGPAAAELETAELETAVLEGYGPIDAPTARRLAALAPTWQRLFTDCTTGQALGVGRAAYRPPKALRRYLNCRDGTCRFPGCTRQATACEPDHTIEWQDGGTTDPGNLAMLCPKHHALKSIGAWSYTHSAAGDLSWLSPLGREYVTEPTEFGMSFHPNDLPERTLKPANHSALFRGLVFSGVSLFGDESFGGGSSGPSRVRRPAVLVMSNAGQTNADRQVAWPPATGTSTAPSQPLDFCPDNGR